MTSSGLNALILQSASHFFCLCGKVVVALIVLFIIALSLVVFLELFATSSWVQSRMLSEFHARN